MHFGARGKSRVLTFAPATADAFCMSESLDKTRSSLEMEPGMNLALLLCYKSRILHLTLGPVSLPVKKGPMPASSSVSCLKKGGMGSIITSSQGRTVNLEEL